ncbi:MAG: hypothetical protein WA364_22145 [Candidatus Nitrosopolaris sp.]
MIPKLHSSTSWLALIIAILMGAVTIYALLLYPLLFTHNNTQVGTGGRGWVPTVHAYSNGYLQGNIIRPISILCLPTQSPTQMFSWNWCAW